MSTEIINFDALADETHKHTVKALHEFAKTADALAEKHKLSAEVVFISLLTAITSLGIGSINVPENLSRDEFLDHFCNGIKQACTYALAIKAGKNDHHSCH